MTTKELLPYTIDYSTLDLESHCHEEMWCGRDYFSDREAALTAIRQWNSDFNHILHFRLHVRGPDINRYVPVHNREHVKMWAGILAQAAAVQARLEMAPDSYDAWLEDRGEFIESTHDHDDMVSTYTHQVAMT